LRSYPPQPAHPPPACPLAHAQEDMYVSYMMEHMLPDDGGSSDDIGLSSGNGVDLDEVW